MTIHRPIDSTVQFETVYSDLVYFQWKSDGIIADFYIPNDLESLLRVTFDDCCIVRILDEFPLSTEEDISQGLVCNHFAYEVTDSIFERTQSATWKEVFSPVKHYRFITGLGCLDVLSAAQPKFLVINKSNSPN